MPTLTAPPPLLDRYPPGSIRSQDGLDQPTWVVDRGILADLARDTPLITDEIRAMMDIYMATLGVTLAPSGAYYKFPRHDSVDNTEDENESRRSSSY